MKQLSPRLIFEEHSFDQKSFNEVTTRAFTISRGGGYLDFDQHNLNKLVIPGERKRQLKNIEDYGKETDAMPIKFST